MTPQKLPIDLFSATVNERWLEGDLTTKIRLDFTLTSDVGRTGHAHGVLDS